jgi:hypothetical protein
MILSGVDRRFNIRFEKLLAFPSAAGYDTPDARCKLHLEDKYNILALRKDCAPSIQMREKGNEGITR